MISVRVVVVGLCVGLSLAGGAQASSGYPSSLADHLGTTKIPACTVCHESNAGGAGTVVKDFGTAMLAAGLTGGGDDTALFAALDQLGTDATDSDGDGVGDIDELVAGGDPNDPGDGGVANDEETLQYGFFGCSALPGTSSSAGALWAGALLLALVRRRR